MNEFIGLTFEQAQECEREQYCFTESCSLWVSVKDKLPEERHQEVLITNGTNIGIGWIGNDRSSWFDHLDHPHYARIHHSDITHWSYLPEVPK